jgi:hypothetical protein
MLYMALTGHWCHGHAPAEDEIDDGEEQLLQGTAMSV